MPLYDYRCPTCGDFREFRPMSESSASVACAVCGAPSERVIAPPFLAGKGSGGGGAQRRNGQTGMPRLCGHGHGCSHSHGD